MADGGTAAADLTLAAELVEGAVQPISEGYRELVDKIREDPFVGAIAASDDHRRGTLDQILSSRFVDDYRKKNHELVTGGELRAGRWLKEQLSARRPQDGHSGEETGRTASTNGRWWIDDPVDGTAALIKTAIAEALRIDYPVPTPRFGISLALVVGREATIGAVAELRPCAESAVGARGAEGHRAGAPPRATGLWIAGMWMGHRNSDGYATETLHGAALAGPSRPADAARPVHVLTTAPEVMFRDGSGRRDYVKEAGLERLLRSWRQPAPIVDGNVVRVLSTAGGDSVAYERDLTAEDVAAAIPILRGCGVRVSDDRGNPLIIDDLKREYTLVAGVGRLQTDSLRQIRAGEDEARRAAAPDSGGRPAHPFFDALLGRGQATGYTQKFGSD